MARNSACNGSRMNYFVKLLPRHWAHTWTSGGAGWPRILSLILGPANVNGMGAPFRLPTFSLSLSLSYCFYSSPAHSLSLTRRRFTDLVRAPGKLFAARELASGRQRRARDWWRQLIAQKCSREHSGGPSGRGATHEHG